MSRETFRNCMVYNREYAGHEVIWMGGGEPTLNIHITDMIMDAFCENTQVAIISNGSNEEVMLKLHNASKLVGDALHVTVSRDIYHDEDMVSDKVKKLYWKDAGKNYFNGGHIYQGRAKKNRLMKRVYKECACSGPFVKPDGSVHICGCDTSYNKPIGNVNDLSSHMHMYEIFQSYYSESEVCIREGMRRKKVS